jgi:predicted hotdog family 3-hydroxylacyl-ACP dehydratase
MSDKLPSEINVLDVIPHRAPVVMIDRLLHADAKKSISSFHVESSCIFCENGYLSESGLIENIAQTGAAGLGYLDRQAGQEISIGYIAGIKDISVSQLPPVGSQISTEIHMHEPVLNFNIVSGKVLLEEKEIASCEMRIFVKR